MNYLKPSFWNNKIRLWFNDLNAAEVISVDLSTFKPGVYAVRYTLDGQTHIDKIIK